MLVRGYFFRCNISILHKSGITLWPLTGEVNNTDYLFTTRLLASGIQWEQVNFLSSKFMCYKQKK